MTDREVNLVFLQLAALPGAVQSIDIDPGHVRDVVTVGLQPADGANFCSKNEILRSGEAADAVAGGKGSVITDLIGPPGAAV